MKTKAPRLCQSSDGLPSITIGGKSLLNRWIGSRLICSTDALRITVQQAAYRVLFYPNFSTDETSMIFINHPPQADTQGND
ncbi:MAG: hypothetical protein MK226_04440 [Saprospiraceae bacterium]|nr:hypothetical protein [Saprospiraceae bacterium]